MALYEELQNLLNSDTAIRTAAEARMKQLEFTDGYGVYLAELIMNQSFAMALRQLAAVMLTKYVDAHWSELEKDTNDVDVDGGAPNEVSYSSSVVIPEQAKRMIRNILPNGLYDPNSKIRTSVAYCISTIAALDWPGQWTELFDIIVKCLGGNENSIHGAMQVLTEFSHDLDTQISVVGPTIMSEVYRIFEAEAQYTVKTRTSAVQIIKQLLKSINEHVEARSEKERLLLPLLPGLVDKMMASLASQDAAVSSFRMKTEIVKVLAYMANEMQRFVQPYTAQILPTIWQLLTQTADMYVKCVVNGDGGLNASLGSVGSGGGGATSDDDDDDELQNFITMVMQLIEFIHALIESGKFKAAIKNVLSDLMYVMIVYMQFTESQLEDWSEDADRFVDEDYQEQDGANGSIRIVAEDVLICIARELGASLVLSSLSAALARHAAVAEAEQAAGSRNWWKIHEASIKAVGGYKYMIVEQPQKFDLSQYLNYVRNVMAAGHRVDTTPYLLGRCLWLLSRFSSSPIYGAQMLEEILSTTQTSLAADKPLNLRIFAVQSVLEVCRSLNESAAEQKALVAQRMLAFLDGIVAIVPLGKASVLSLVLETVTVMASFDAAFTADAHTKIIPLSIAVFLKHHDDPYLLEHVQDILKILCQNRFCLVPLQEKIVPTLISILNLQGEHTNSAMQEIALDILTTLVRYVEGELPAALIEGAFPAAVQCILRSDDNSIMQSGGECLRAFIYVAPQQVCAYKNGEGLNYVMQIATQLLNPMNTEFSATFVGRLVITIITRAGNLIGENIYLLLKAVISKMQLVTTLSVTMSLVMTFAHLIVTQMEAVLNFLSTVPGPTGEPAIQYVFGNWLTRQHMFYGAYERKVSTMALCKLFEHGVTTQDPRLTTVTVRDVVENATTSRMRVTRSRATNVVWTDVPILVKIFKLLINELANLKEMRAGADLTEDEDEENGATDSGEGSESGDGPGLRTSDMFGEFFACYFHVGRPTYIVLFITEQTKAWPTMTTS